MKNKKKKAALHNLGCKVNAYETQVMEQMLRESEYEIVSFQEEADVYVINTCTVTNIADRKSRQMLHRARKKNPNAVIVAAGCYVQSAAEEIVQDLSIDIVIGNNQKNELIPLLEQFWEEREHLADIVDIAKETEYEDMTMYSAGEHTRAFLKIQDGCNQFCTYCIIPYARGRIRSKQQKKVVEEVSRLAKAGYKEVVLTGIHLSSYGKDQKDADVNLATVIEAVDKIEGIERIRLGSLEQGIVTEEFLARMKQVKSFCPHFHLSLQSGCKTVLERMNRHYTPQQYLETCKKIRQVFEHAAITTDVITGFPGETIEEFEETKQFVKQVEFAQMHIFPYSVRKGTKAAEMKPQIQQAEKSRRAEELIQIGKQLEQKYKEYYIGKEEAILLEECMMIGQEQYMTGYTKEYVKVAVKTKEDLTNRICVGKVTGMTEGEILLAEIVNLY